MGQQQLLLLVLGIVIVGLAVIVGIQAFAENSDRAKQDALVADGIRIVNNAQVWGLKPGMYGGGDDAFTSVTLDLLDYETGANDYYENVNGVYSLEVISAEEIVVLACDAPGTAGTIKVQFVVDGFKEENIGTDTEATAIDCPGS